MLNLYSSNSSERSYSGLKESKPIKNSKKRTVYESFYNRALDDSEGLSESVLDRQKFSNEVKTDNLITSLDSGSFFCRPATNIPDAGGAVYAFGPDQFSYKALVPISQQSQAQSVKFDFSYAARWFKTGVAYTSPIASFTADVYLTLATFDYNVLTNTGSLIASGTEPKSAGFRPIMNIRLAPLEWVNEGSVVGFRFNQPLATTNLLKTVTRGSISNYRDFNQNRDKITSQDLNNLLKKGPLLAFGVAINLQPLTGPQQTFIIDNINDFNLYFAISYSFQYYARLIQL